MYLLQVTDTIVSDVVLSPIQEFLIKFGVRLAIDILSVVFLIRYIYFPIYKQRELFFTYLIFNLIIFFMCYFLNKVEMSMGAAFGLFAIFGMLRYRTTEDISIKDMTYLFLVIAMGLLSAVMKLKDISYKEEFVLIIGLNALIILITWLLEGNLFMKRELSKIVVYENIELVKADRGAELLQNLRERTGLDIHRYDTIRIDFLRDVAQIKVYYYEKRDKK